MDKKQFLYLMSKLSDAYPRDPMTESRFELYYEFLGNEDSGKLLEAINEHIVSAKWFPQVSELKALLHPPKTKDEEYLNYLDRKNLEFAETMRPMIEYQGLGREEASKFLSQLEEKEREEADERKKRFLERKKLLEEQKKILGVS